ncbi:MAG: hypothetical protein MHM6MM_009326, partial [Cercozoa sp. M6MM]
MGIKNLSKLLQDRAPGCVRVQQLGSYLDRVVAIDASTALYQFLVSVRSQGADGSFELLTNEAGEVTSHLQGLLYRTIRLVEAGIQPVYVFDGKPPEMKSHELTKRKERRAQAEQSLKEAKEEDRKDDVAKYESRLVKVTTDHVNDAKRLLEAMGLPWVQAPCEA